MPQTKPMSWISTITMLMITLTSLAGLTPPTNFKPVPTPKKLMTQKSTKW